jgi:hypothetical protein
VPTVVEDYAPAGYSRIGTPVAPVRRNGDCWLHAQGLPADGTYSTDCAFIYERRYLVADRCFEPIVHGMDNAAATRSSRRNGLHVSYPRDQGLLAKNVKIGIQGAFDERRVAARRSADVDEIKRFVTQQIVHTFVPLSARTSLKKGPALGLDSVGRGDNLNVL